MAESNLVPFLTAAELASFGDSKERVEGRLTLMMNTHDDFKVIVDKRGNVFIRPSLKYGFDGYGWDALQERFTEADLRFPILPENPGSSLLSRTVGAALKGRLGYDVFIGNAIRVKLIDLIELGQSYTVVDTEVPVFEETLGSFFGQTTDDIEVFEDKVRIGENGGRG